MQIGKFIYGKLSADATLAGYVGTRIYPNVIPINYTLPAIIYETRNVIPQPSKVSVSHLDTYEVAIIVFANNYDTGYTIAARIRAVLDYYSGTVNSVVCQNCTYMSTNDYGYDEQANVYGIELMFKLRISV